jgi:transposase-like protein
MSGMEKQLSILRQNAGSWEKAAKALGISARQLYNWRRNPEKLHPRNVTWIQIVASTYGQRIDR